MSRDEAPEAQQPAPPLLRVVRGNPSAAEVAALVTVVSAIGAASTAVAHEAADSSHWSAPSRLHRPPIFPGNAGNWWASGLPR